MRIGNLEDLNQTDRSDPLVKLLQPENQKPLTTAQKVNSPAAGNGASNLKRPKGRGIRPSQQPSRSCRHDFDSLPAGMKNWWYYHKWYVIVGAVLLFIVCSLIGNALGLFKPAPDLQIAYVGKNALPQDTISALQELFTSLAGDYNGDGEIIVQVNQYIRDGQTTDAEAAHYQYASEITLIGDISDCESYFFLLDDPQDFQQEYQLLAAPDGSCPSQADYSTQDKTIRWADCPLLSKAEMGSYTETAAGKDISGSNQELLQELYLGRRCFYTDQTVEHLEESIVLWEKLWDSTA